MVSKSIAFRCPYCGQDIDSFDSSYNNAIALFCANCHTTYPKYNVNGVEIVDFIHLSSLGKCHCNRDGFTECTIDLRAEIGRISPLRNTTLPFNPRVIKALGCLNYKGIRILDLACAEAPYAAYISNSNIVCGLDSCAKRMLLGKENALNKGYQVLVLADAMRPPFASEHFDAIICTELVEHILETRPFLEETNRILKVGGYLILTTPNLVSLWNRVSILFGSGKGFAPWRIVKGKGVYDRWSSIVSPDQALHVRFFTFGSLKNLLNQFGFECCKMVGIDSILSRLPPLDRWLKTLCGGIFIQAIKRSKQF